MDTPHVWHVARNIYEKPRVCIDCGDVICSYPIPVSRNLVGSFNEPNAEYDIQLYYCSLTLNHDGPHGNKKIKVQMRFQW